MKCTEISKPARTEVLPGVWADTRRAIFLARLRLLVVADIHWGYAQSHRAAGNLVPLWGDAEISRALTELLDDYSPQEVIWLGDSLHTLNGRIAAENYLNQLAPDGPKIAVLSGNHDRRWKVPQAKTLQRENYFFHHGDDQTMAVPEDSVEVVGHFHPAVGLYDRAGLRLRVPALVVSERRLILPAFSPWAAGVAWNDRLRPEEKLWAIAPSRVFAVRAARPDLRTSLQ